MHSFPNGSAGGPDGLHPQHLKDLTGASAMGGGKELLRALTAFVNHILQGKVPLSIQSSFFRCHADCSTEERGGYTADRSWSNPPTSSIQVRQLLCPPVYRSHACTSTVGVPHSVVKPLFMLLASTSVKLDFSNDRMPMAVKDSVPELYSFIISAYGNSSHLFCGEHLLHSAEGVHAAR